MPRSCDPSTRARRGRAPLDDGRSSARTGAWALDDHEVRARRADHANLANTRRSRPVETDRPPPAARRPASVAGVAASRSGRNRTSDTCSQSTGDATSPHPVNGRGFTTSPYVLGSGRGVDLIMPKIHNIQGVKERRTHSKHPTMTSDIPLIVSSHTSHDNPATSFSSSI